MSDEDVEHLLEPILVQLVEIKSSSHCEKPGQDAMGTLNGMQGGITFM